MRGDLDGYAVDCLPITYTFWEKKAAASHETLAGIILMLAKNNSNGSKDLKNFRLLENSLFAQCTWHLPAGD